MWVWLLKYSGMRDGERLAKIVQLYFKECE